jgi:hypothetical protein
MKKKGEVATKNLFFVTLGIKREKSEKKWKKWKKWIFTEKK